MIRIYLIRHGETTWNKLGKFQGRADIDLSEIGLAQAKKTGDYMKNICIDGIYSSPLKRAFNTAKIIGTNLKASIKKDKRLIEIDFGEWEGLSPKIIEMKWPGKLRQMFYFPDEVDIPGGESFKDVQNRTKLFLDELISLGQNKTYMIVSHGVALRTIYCNLLGVPLINAWNLSQKNASISCIDYYDKDRSVLSFLNLTNHLDK